MISVGVKELKDELSSFFAGGREGEEIVTTDHGKDVALIMPLSRRRRTVMSRTWPKKGSLIWKSWIFSILTALLVAGSFKSAIADWNVVIRDVGSKLH